MSAIAEDQPEAVATPEIRTDEPAVRKSRPVDTGLRLATCGFALSLLGLVYLFVRPLFLSPAAPVVYIASAGESQAAESTSDVAIDARIALEPLALDAEAGLVPLSAAVAARGPRYDDPLLDRYRDPAGTGDAASAEIPRAKRWQVSYADGINEVAYAQQLDFLGIELGALMGEGKIAYASAFADPKPKTREGAVSAEQRLYMSWNRGDLLEADRTLLARAGVDAADRIVLHFYSDETLEKLAKLEESHAGREPVAIAWTRFGVRPAGDSFEIYVIEQRSRE